MALAASATVAGWRISLSMAGAGTDDSATAVFGWTFVTPTLVCGATFAWDSSADCWIGAEASVILLTGGGAFCSVTADFVPQPLARNNNPIQAQPLRNNRIGSPS